MHRCKFPKAKGVTSCVFQCGKCGRQYGLRLEWVELKDRRKVKWIIKGGEVKVVTT